MPPSLLQPPPPKTQNTRCARPPAADEIQGKRRSVLARLRNTLVAYALDTQDAVFWVDSDVTNMPQNALAALVGSGKDIVTAVTKGCARGRSAPRARVCARAQTLLTQLPEQRQFSAQKQSAAPAAPPNLPGGTRGCTTSTPGRCRARRSTPASRGRLCQVTVMTSALTRPRTRTRGAPRSVPVVWSVAKASVHMWGALSHLHCSHTLGV